MGKRFKNDSVKNIILQNKVICCEEKDKYTKKALDGSVLKRPTFGKFMEKASDFRENACATLNLVVEKYQKCLA